MSADFEETNFEIEFEARIEATDEEEALRTAREQLRETESLTDVEAEQWDWMAVKIP